METKTIKNIFILTVFILFSIAAKASNSIKLDIKIVKVFNEKILCNFRYHFEIIKSDSIQMYLCSLPFTQNPKINSSLVTNDADLLVTYGFNSTGKGLININSFGKAVNFDIEFSNVELQLKPSLSDENGLIVTLDFSNKALPEISRPFEIVSLKEFQISNSTLINSNPKFKLVENSTYQLTSFEMLENVYFIIPKPKESFVSTFFAFMTIAIFIGIFGSIKLLKGKTQSIFGGIIGLLILIYLAYLVISKIIPEDFTKDIDMISLIGGGIGLAIGIVLNSAYNLITIKAIERQQG